MLLRCYMNILLNLRSNQCGSHQLWFNSLRHGLILTASICLSTARAATWYAAVDGQSSSGTYASPWSVQFAVGKVPNNLLKPGDTVIFKDGGPYVCSEIHSAYSVGQALAFRISGTTSAKITYRAESLWGFSFNGGILLPNTVSNLVFQNFRVFYSGSVKRIRTDELSHPGGINDFGVGNAILHNLIENTGHPGIGSWKTTRGKEIAGNIIRFTGFADYTGGYNGANRGSGMYLQNADNSPEALIEGNISYFNYTTGMKAYGNTDIWNFNFRHNITALNPEAGIFYHVDNYPSKGVKVASNFSWNSSPPIRIGYALGNGGHSGAIVTGNYAVDFGQPLQMVDGWSDTVWTNNVAVNLSDRYLWSLEVAGETSGDIASHTFDYNTYWAKDSGGFGSGPFYIKDASTSFSSWKSQVRGDSHSTFTYGLPNGVVVKAFAPSRDPNFVHVSVFNWSKNAQTTVDLSAYFNAGDRLNIYDAQELPVSYTSLVYQGGTVVLDLARTSIAPMLGTFPGYTQSDHWSGFDPRFRAFVIHRGGNRPEPPSNLRVLK